MNLLTSRLLYGLAGSLCLFAGIAAAQGHRGDVTVAVIHDKVIALPAGGSGMEESLGLNETVIVTEARGQTAFAQTSNRLLGFSSEFGGGQTFNWIAENRSDAITYCHD